ncbi:mediator of RNA polymerase II transcription subunit 14 [Aspergillus udagawae]|nr:mediator of RNA polymerase II transcription subunit 14 [Aspergillus udagawae]GFG19452.1 mediator of RNA polymerase II transcription subunit 14 [Aspergillus udagawae]
MPGVIMDNGTVGGPRHAPDTQTSSNADNLRNGSLHVNGAAKGAKDHNRDKESYTGSPGIDGHKALPELPHITQGFFPFSTLVNRSVQQCWNELSDLITELAAIQVSPHSSIPLLPVNGKSAGNQSPENLQKKLRILDFAHAKRAEFIKLLVLSQWSRQARDVSKLIDLQNFVRARHQAFVDALQRVGDMKRDLVQAQVANPDLQTALEILSKGRLESLADLGYKSSKLLTARGALRRLHKVNRIISARLALHDSIPRPFRTYRVHDGRVTFVVSGEFELDLSVGAESELSQFFFVDIRFLYSPSSNIPKGRMSNELDAKINDKLRDSGLTGCFNFLHGLVLTNKIHVLFKQAIELAKGLWSETLRVELLHRTLVIQYWALKPGPKSWVEIGIKSSNGNADRQGFGVPCLGLRWMRDGQDVDSSDIEFDTDDLSMECLLRSVVALHISHLLSSAYGILSEYSLFSTGTLSSQAILNVTEPGECQLSVQLTGSRHLRVSIEPMSGAVILSATPGLSERSESDASLDRSTIDDLVARVSRLRCIAAIEELESNVRILGFETVSLKGLRNDIRKVFPTNVLRFSLFWHPSWERNWVVAATSSIASDNWWVVQLRRSSEVAADFSGPDTSVPLCSGHSMSDTFLATNHQTHSSSFPDLGYCLSGMVAIYANVSYLADLQTVEFHPPLRTLKVESDLQIPDIFIRYQVSHLPPALQLVLPAGLRRKNFLKNTVRLVFHGIDRRKNIAIFVAYGNLVAPLTDLCTLVSKSDSSLVFKRGGSSFALRLLAPAGRPVIIQLFRSLQSLECTLSILDFLRQRRLTPQSLSLTHIAFAYGPRRDLSAIIGIGLSEVPSSAELDPVRILARTDPLLFLTLGIRFNHPNPHRRVQGSLAAILNHASNEAGLDFVTEILSFTLPLMRALEQITSNASRQESFRLQVIVRNAYTFLLHYTYQGFCFQLTTSQHMGQLTWVLRELSSPEARPGHDQLKARLRGTLYHSKGNGWKGLGNGVVADAEGVSNAIWALDGCFTGTQHNTWLPRENKSDQDYSTQPISEKQSQTGAPSQAGMANDTTMTANFINDKSLQRNPVASNAADVITID